MTTAARRAAFRPLRVARVDRLTDDAAAVTFDVPADAAPSGRLGQHGPELAGLLEELQGLARAHPEATW